MTETQTSKWIVFVGRTMINNGSEMSGPLVPRVSKWILTCPLFDLFILTLSPERIGFRFLERCLVCTGVYVI